MKEHPILMSSEMVRALLDGRKSQTRRIIKSPQRLEGLMLKGEEAEWCPYGKVGDRLWVKEKHSLGGNGVFFPDSCDGSVHIAWTSGRFMKKIYARIWLEVTGIGAERVQEISGEDCIAEGIEPVGDPMNEVWDDEHIKQFAQLWNSLNAKRGYGWDENPWVWVIEFKRVQEMPDGK